MQTCIREVKLYGDLADACGFKSFKADIKTAADAVKFLIGNKPELDSYMCSKYYKIIVENKPITLEEIHYPAGTAPIKIIPVVSGQKRGLGQILLGAALIGLTFFTGGAFIAQVPLINAGSLAFTGFLPKAAFYIGAGLVLNGISTMLTPVPTVDNSEGDPENSFAFSSPVNVNRAGIPIPLIYGRRVVGSAVISAGIDVIDIT